MADDGEEVIAALTALLVVITGYYAMVTQYMMEEARQTRQQEREFRERDRTEEAGLRCLEPIRRVHDEMMRRGGVVNIHRDEIGHVSQQLRHNAPLITDDEELRDHLPACAEVAYVASFEPSQMELERLDPASVRLAFREIAGATEGSLYAYLKGEARHAWHWRTTLDEDDDDQLPSPTNAGSWIRERGRRKS